jgi:hypothetical protein
MNGSVAVFPVVTPPDVVKRWGRPFALGPMKTVRRPALATVRVGYGAPDGTVRFRNVSLAPVFDPLATYGGAS